jgi:uncharacterized protein (TIGR00255 family)
MTGFGEGRSSSSGVSISVEVRAVNNRYLKVSVRGSDPYPMLEPDIEKILRQKIRRGTITVIIRAQRESNHANTLLNQEILGQYIHQIRQLSERLGLRDYTPLLNGVLLLPGVTNPNLSDQGQLAEEERLVMEQALHSAIDSLQQMRYTEGQAMALELMNYHQRVSHYLNIIRGIVPQVAANYRLRMRERIRVALSDSNISTQEEDLIREVAIFAERIDISEEIMRLSSHLDQFKKVVQEEKDSPGRKLEFLVQEMGRETNTIGSKSGDVTISRHTVEIKAELEKIRELVQNIE